MSDHAPTRLAQQQFALARHLRDPHSSPPPVGLEERRLAVYRELFLNNIEGLLASGFPVIRKTLGDARWRPLVRAFYREHRSHTPLFAEIGGEFTRFLQDRAGTSDQPAWLPELAHYEWVELALQLAAVDPPAHDMSDDLLDGVPVVSPLAWPLAYQWPVQRISPDFQPDALDPAPTLLLVRRTEQHDIRFAELSPLVYRLLQLLGEGTHTGRDALRTLAEEAQATDSEEFFATGSAMLQRLRVEGTLVGARVVPEH